MSFPYVDGGSAVVSHSLTSRYRAGDDLGCACSRVLSLTYVAYSLLNRLDLHQAEEKRLDRITVAA
jgi:hypothetical protein